MKVLFSDFHGQFKAIEGEIRDAIDTVLSSGWYILGEQCMAFEGEFARYVGVAEAVGVGSGTSAIQLALSALGIGPGDEVITVANTCVPTVAGIAGTGARPVLVDIVPLTFTMDPERLAEAVTPRTRAIVPVHLYGHPCDMYPILEVAGRHAIPIVEDCAQAHGAKYHGRRCGCFGRAAAFSFYPTKNLGALGDGGAVVTDDPELARTVRMMRNYGEEKRYHHTVPGTNSRLDEIQAAVLRVKLRHLEKWNAARRERARAYNRRLAGLNVVTPYEADIAWHVYHLYVVRSARRDALRAHLDGQGVGTLMHYPVPVHLQEACRDLGYLPGAFPRSERACEEVLSLPLYPEMPPGAVDEVADAIAAF